MRGSSARLPEQVNRLVALLSEPEANLAAQLRARDLHVGAYCIVGGAKNLKRDRSLAHFTRDDDAWFDFTITVRAQAGQLELLAYDFEIRFPPGRGSPFLRIDLNLPRIATTSASFDRICTLGPMISRCRRR